MTDYTQLANEAKALDLRHDLAAARKACGMLAALADALLACQQERDELVAEAKAVDADYHAQLSSAREAASVLLKALGWSSGGLGSAAIEIVAERDRLAAEVERLQKSQCPPCGIEKAIDDFNAGLTP